jgi:hypothetical protein
MIRSYSYFLFHASLYRPFAPFSALLFSVLRSSLCSRNIKLLSAKQVVLIFSACHLYFTILGVLLLCKVYFYFNFYADDASNFFS